MRYLDGISFSGYAIVGALLKGVMNTDSSQPPRQSSEMAARARFVKMASLEKVREDPWINRARASSHHKSIQRRESMVVSMAHAAVNRGERTAVAQVAGHEFQIGEISPEQFCRSSGAILVVDSVKAEFADSALKPIYGPG
jgi:hypothetical protein